jgi:hypothetical protein
LEATGAAPSSQILLEDEDLSKNLCKKRLTEHLQRTGFSLIPCPPPAFDYNVAEDVLSYMSKNIRRQNYNNLGDLKSRIEVEWSSISVVKINKLVLSMPSRICDIIVRGGKPI